jgi:tetratricopeptide (TPR) repeat protein
MMFKISCTFLSLALAGWPVVQTNQPWASEPEVVEGIRLVEEGDYDAAILTLDRAARRLAADPAKTQVLSYAYLYLGIAYLGKGHEAAAKAKFRDAISQLKDLSLSPEEYPPKVIDLFEAAREEASEPAEPTAVPAQPEPEEKKGGSKMPLILLGVGGAAAAGVLAASGGGSDNISPTPTPTEPVASPEPQMETRSFPGILTHDEYAVDLVVGPGGSGHWEAQLNYTNAEARDLWMEVYTEGGQYITAGRALTTTSFIAEWDTDAGGRFFVTFGFDPEVPGPAPGQYELVVTYPIP